MHLPEKFEKKMRGLLGEDCDNYFDSFGEGYGQTCRVNQLKMQPAELLRRFSVSPVPWCETGFYYKGENRLSLHPFYYGGAYYIQEPCAMAPASFLPVKPGDRVLDLCAAPGGKTTALAAKMQGEGILIANDISISRCRALLKNMEMAGIKNAVITCESPEHLSQRFAGYFDCILVDAPCSGEGMFRKEPSMAADWSPEEVQRYSTLQKEIVHAAARMVRPGGYLLYSTCTYSPEENEQVVETLLASGRDIDTENVQAPFACAKEADEEGACGLFQLEELPLYPGVDKGHPEWSRSGEESLTCCRRFWNHRVKGEGQFAALLRRVDETESREKAPGPFIPAQDGLTGEMRDFFAHCRLAVPEERLQFLKERVFLLPEGCPDLSGLRVVRSGLYLGDCKKKRFEPGQALAMALRKEEYDNVLSLPLSDERVERYLRGETIQADGPDGWVLVCVEELPLGWGKSIRGNIKNKIEPGWRKQ